MSKNTSKNRVLALLLVSVMLFSLFSPVTALAAEKKVSGNDWEKVVELNLASLVREGSVIERSEKESGYKDSDIVRVLIILDGKSTLEAGYASEDIAYNKKAMAYRSTLQDKQRRMEDAISKKIGSELKVEWNLTLAANIISADVEYGQIEAIKSVRGVKDVRLARFYEAAVVGKSDEPNMGTATDMTGAQSAWADGLTGAGSRVAIIDTGLDLRLELINGGAFEYALAENADEAGLSYDEYVEGLNLLDQSKVMELWSQLNISKWVSSFNAASAYKSSKVPFAANYFAHNLNPAHTSSAHGSHVTGIAAANRYVPDGDGYAPSLEKVYTQGNAPDAQVLAMQVFGSNGSTSEDVYFAAIEDAIILGADAMNLSLGSGMGGISYSDDYEELYDAVTESGANLVISSGNSYYWAWQTVMKAVFGDGYLYSDGVNFHTNGSPGSYTNSLTVASVNNDGATGAYLSVAGNKYNYNESDYSNLPLSTIAGTHEYVYIDTPGVTPMTSADDDSGATAIGNPDYDDFAKLGSEVLTGKIAICNRGVSSFFVKAEAAVAQGAIAVIIANNQAEMINMDLSSYTKTQPVVLISQAAGREILSNSAANEGNLTYYTGSMEISDGVAMISYGSDYYTMSDFSSWGTPGNLELTPEITAPGGNIYSMVGQSSEGPAGYESWSGTSMAAPQITGITAVLAQYVRDNGLLEKTGLSMRQLTQSLLMSTAVPMLDAYGEYYPVFQQGAGLVNVAAASNAHTYVLMNEDATESHADGKIKAELKDDPDRENEYSFSFTLNNLTDEDREFSFRADFFTQDIYPFQMGDILDTATVPLTAKVTWEVNGEEVEPTVEPNVRNCDYDNDGDVDEDDGIYLLEYLVDNKDVLYHSEYADLDDDGDIDTYDAYLFFLGFGTEGIIVPAEDSIEVKVTFTLLNIDDYDVKGAYIEGYVFAEEESTGEGVEGDVHSIPVLGYYGNYVEPSMFDVTTYNEFIYDPEARYPYLYLENGTTGNVVYFVKDGEMYPAGGNLLDDGDEGPEQPWFPERDAINNTNQTGMYFCLIRNAEDVRLFLNDGEGSEIDSADLGQIYCAYYYVNGASWEDLTQRINLTTLLSSLAEGDRFEVGLEAVPELYAGRFDEAGEGKSISYSFIVDNTAPVIHSYEYNEETGILTVTASDNEYVAALILTDDSNAVVGKMIAGEDAVHNGQADYEFDLNGIDTTRFQISAYDYAYNGASVKFDLGGGGGDISVTVTPETAEIYTGSTVQLTATVEPWGTDESVTWTSSDERVATVDENGLVTGVGAGRVQITATSDVDPTASDSAVITVSSLDYTVKGELQDEKGAPLTFSWNLAKDGWKKVADTENYILAGAPSYMYDGLYFYNQSSSTGDFALVDYESGRTLQEFAGSGVGLYDIAESYVYSVLSRSNWIYGVQGAYLAMADLNDFEATLGAWNLASTGVTNFVGVEDFGYMPYNGDYLSIVGLLDDDGNFWLYAISYDLENPTLYSFNGYPVETGLAGTDFSGYNGTHYCSLLTDSDGNLWLSHFNSAANTSELILITDLSEGDLSEFQSAVVGNVGDGVWPMVLIQVSKNSKAARGEKALVKSLEPEFALNFGEPVAVNAEKVGAESLGGLPSAPAVGGVNLFNGEELPTETGEGDDDGSEAGVDVSEGNATASEVEISEDQKTVTVTLIAHDSEGNNADVTNGLTNVTYDPEKLELVSAEVKAQYSALNTSEEGTVKFDYVQMDGIKEGETVAVLVFKVKAGEDGPEDTEITVDWTEVNDEDPVTDPENPEEEPEEGFEEVLAVDFEEDPGTGDETNLYGWTVWFAVAAAGLLLILAIRKRRSEG